MRKDAAVQGGSCHEQNVGLDQKDAFHVRTCAHSDISRDLPEDILRKCAVRQEHIIICGLHEIPRYLNDEDVGVAFACTMARALEVDIPRDQDVRAEGVDAGR